MSRVTDAIRKHHRQIADALGAHVTALVEEKKEADPRGLIHFLKTDLLPHARGEEQHLYPIMDSLVKTGGRATATMSVDHEFIENYIKDLDETLQAIEKAPAAERPALENRLRSLALQLAGIVQLHVEKEERVYLPLFEKHLTDPEQERILKGMHQVHNGEKSKTDAVWPTLDVTPLPPAQRHTLIFETFAALKPNEAFVLLNDHDPKPLYYQFKYELDGCFTWDYVQRGPEHWRVRIGRIGGALPKDFKVEHRCGCGH